MAEIAATDPDVVVRLASTAPNDLGVVLRKPGKSRTELFLTTRRGVRLVREGVTTTWSWAHVVTSDPLPFCAAVMDAAIWAQASIPISTSAQAAGAIAIREILNVTSLWGENVQVYNRYMHTDDPTRPYLAPLPDFPSLRNAVRDQVRSSVNFGDHVALDRWWLVTYFGKHVAVVDFESGVLHQTDRVERLPVGFGVDGRKAIRGLVMDLISREC
ncbi:hypothetical protein [Amnibacterium endophyticum]|uniref:Uncharacterized protein n=1 Tax=Amnibacterium endophyticum TaxID=2109337 RepID=A0ABW4LCA4_9MICO